MALCTFEGCNRLQKTRGWCQKHYVRWLTAHYEREVLEAIFARASTIEAGLEV